MHDNVGKNAGVFTTEQKERTSRSSYGELWDVAISIDHVFADFDDWYLLNAVVPEIACENTGAGKLSHYDLAFFDFDLAQAPGASDYRSQQCARARFDPVQAPDAGDYRAQQCTRALLLRDYRRDEGECQGFRPKLVRRNIVHEDS